MEEKKCMPCWCRLILAILIIVWIWWWTPAWANWAITIAAALIAIVSLSGRCCCSNVGCKIDSKEEAPKDQS